MTDVEQLQPDTDISGLSNRSLLLAHTELHSYWKEFESGRDIEQWDRDSLIRVHIDVRDEIEKRGLPHQELNSLDDETVPLQMEVQFELVEPPEYEQVGESYLEKGDRT